MNMLTIILTVIIILMINCHNNVSNNNHNNNNNNKYPYRPRSKLTLHGGDAVCSRREISWTLDAGSALLEMGQISCLILPFRASMLCRGSLALFRCFLYMTNSALITGSLVGWPAGWVPGCLGAWVPGCLGAWVPGCLGAWVPACLPGCLAAWLPCYLYNII